MTGRDADRRGRPGVSRGSRLSGEGLERLERQLREGSNISAMVLRQWVIRYGEPARTLLRKYGMDPDQLDEG